MLELLCVAVPVQKSQSVAAYPHPTRLQVKTENYVVLRSKYAWVGEPEYTVAKHRRRQDYDDAQVQNKPVVRQGFAWLEMPVAVVQAVLLHEILP